MRMFCILIISFFSVSVLWSQEIQRYGIASSTAGSSILNGLVFQSNVGELFVSTNSNSNGQFTQGFLQNDPFTVITSSYHNELNSKLIVYPCPFEKEITVDYIGGGKITKIEVFSSLGEMLSNLIVVNNTLSIMKVDFANQQNGLYFLKVYFDNGNSFKIFKVIKAK